MDSPLILGFASACVAVQLWPFGPIVKQRLFAVNKRPKFTPAGLFSVFGQVVGHSDWGHLQQNMVLLLLAGPACESALGPVRLSKIMGCTCIASSLTRSSPWLQTRIIARVP